MTGDGIPKTLLKALNDRDIHLFRSMFVRTPDASQLRDEVGNTLLIVAARSDVQFVEELLAAGADPNWPGLEGMTPLMVAAESRRPEVSLTLLRHGAIVDLTDRYGRTALHHAAISRSPDLVRVLVQGGANPSTRDQFGLTPLVYSRRRHVMLGTSSGGVQRSLTFSVFWDDAVGRELRSGAQTRDSSS